MEVRQFNSLEEIQATPGYKAANPITRETYKAFLGHYTFAQDVHCCFRNPSGNLCNEQHRFGFVVKLKDNTISIVGNKCATDKLGADSSIRADATRYINERRRKEKIAALDEIIQSYDSYYERLTNLLGKIDALQLRRDEFVASLGQAISNSLADMARRNATRVTVSGIRIREQKLQDGSIERERVVIPLTVGNIRAIRAFPDSTYRALTSSVKLIIRKLASARSVSADARQTQIDEHVSAIRQTDSMERQVETLAADLDNFLATNPTVFCYLTADKSERVRAARLALASQGLSSGRDFAKNWLSQSDSELARQNGADRIEL